jgi:cyclopropane fatty-acyl-phospholipid synthase-like methyltransferase
MSYQASAMQNHRTAHEGFKQHYGGNPPWDIGRPQPPFVAVADLVASPVLDAGCGTGGTALFFAERGCRGTAIDIVEEAIARARATAAARALSVEFLVKDAMTLDDWDRRFDSVIDSGLFHIYAGDERRRYVQGLAHVLRQGGRLFLLSFTEAAPEGGVSVPELSQTFSAGWCIESVQAVRGEVNPAFAAEHPEAFPLGGPPMWFAVIRREG